MISREEGGRSEDKARAKQGTECNTMGYDQIAISCAAGIFL